MKDAPMKKKTQRRKPKRPPSGRPVAPAVLTLQYKIQELSTVDEATLEQAVNRWVGQGWALDGVQFAMRESSKRPAMAFLFFTRQEAQQEQTADELASAEARLQRLADGTQPIKARVTPLSPHERLMQLAGLGDEPLSAGDSDE